jgi:tRNA(fMet)-specific endonuclease VapC
MNLLFDTNIILFIVRANNYKGIINFLNPDNSPIYISLASEAEIKSIAMQNNWGTNRISKLDNFLDEVNIVEINQLYINAYVEIESFSQKRNNQFLEYNFSSPRNMSKNDLWIASLAALLSLRLITTDNDFDHLHSIFFEVHKIQPKQFVAFF